MNFVLSFALFLTSSGDHELSQALLDQFNPNREFAHSYYFIRTCNSFALNEQEKVKYFAHLFENTFSEVPPPLRYERLVSKMASEASEWKEDLGSIDREMRRSKERLSVAKCGLRTQKIQEDILAKLDKLIEEKQNPPPKDGGDAAQKEQDKSDGGKPKGERSSSPAQQSSPDDGDPSKVKLDEKELKRLTGAWGTMSEKERAAAMANVTRDLPPKYKIIVEDFFKALSRDK
jgi:hypothetical protein